MIIDLHIHSQNSDGAFTIEEIVEEAKRRKIGFMSITDHDSIDCQLEAIDLVEKASIRYISGVELNVTFSHPKYQAGKTVSLDFLGYQFEPKNQALADKLQQVAKYRQARAMKILDNLNVELKKKDIEKLTNKDFDEIQASVDGVLGRPHIADYMVKKGIVRNRQEAFDKYLVRCNVPKYKFSLQDASKLVHDADGKMVLAHPNDPHGTSLAALTKSLPEQTQIIKDSMLGYIDGLECWHSRSDAQTTSHYLKFAKKHALMVTGGSDCHQKPILMGTVTVPDYVADQF